MARQTGKRMRRRALEHMLRFMARAVIARHKPLVVGVTGSVGKSSTKEAIALVLSSSMCVRKSEGNFNNEIGVPLTVLGVDSGGSSFLRWFSIGFRFLRLILFPAKYPEVLVLEMGVDRPGDMEYLLGFVPVRIGVVTRIAESHIAYFGSIGNIAKEKGRMIFRLPEDGFAILNLDDPLVSKMAEKTKGMVLSYGFGKDALVRADNASFQETPVGVGFSFKLNYDGKSIPVRLPHVVARHHISDALAGAAVGIALEMNLFEIARSLEQLTPLPGRLRFLRGKRGIGILDDTYNASPASVRAALATLGEIPARRRVVIFGDMLELGAMSEEEHRKLADDVVVSGTELAILVGKRMHLLGEELLARGMPRGSVMFVPDPDAATLPLQSILREGDLVLVKGSRGMRMEKVTEALLADPAEARKHLCCQSPDWRSRPFLPPAEWDVPAV
ncbi:MAG: UDP-N-acetylmuramoyl-tripeptide--D-alanyl-D-alanine ligase [Candidatus Moranbacteria bacterium]|nr:UDP-N-acetylmuramoyl-tripeptide--D-alanyl-D-alanine ligase [Candidatus Moranbacteria bacterium]